MTTPLVCISAYYLGIFIPIFLGILKPIMTQAQETAKGRRERALQGYHNNRPPFGYDKDEDGVLIPNEHELKALHMAFDLYETSEATDNQIAVVLNKDGFVQKSGKPFNTEMIRTMLQNRVYLGYVR